MKKGSRLFPRFVIGSAFSMGVLWSIKSMMDSENKLRLNGKVALITGASRGLGLVIARQLAAEGANVVICARTEKSLQPASEDLSTRTSEFLTIPCDITDKAQVKRMVQQIRDEMGSLDMVINNAGIIQTGPMETMNQEDFESAMKVHFWGPFYVINEILPDMMEKKAGRIVNIVSIGGKVSFPHLLPYNTSKYALSGYSEGLAAELEKYNIKVTTVYPGLMRTGSPRNIDVKGQHEKEYAWFKILDSLPVISIDAERAAFKIIEAMKLGSRTLTLTIPAKLAIAAHGIAPAATITAFNLINYVLPGMGEGEETRKGYQSTSWFSETFLTKKTEEAARENLE